MKQVKYNYLYVLQGNYGYGWDDLVSYNKSDNTAYSQAKSDLKVYRANECGVSHRIINRRELNK